MFGFRDVFISRCRPLCLCSRRWKSQENDIESWAYDSSDEFETFVSTTWNEYDILSSVISWRPELASLDFMSCVQGLEEAENILELE